MTKQSDHPEQDPAEGSRETIDRELARQAEENGSPSGNDKSGGQGTPSGQEPPKHHRPM